MPKTTATYWNPLGSESSQRWKPVRGLEGIVEELTLSIDEETGEYTRLTKFHPCATPPRLAEKRHEYPEEVFIVSGRLYDQAFGMWLETGYYASRPPGEIHGPLHHRRRLCRSQTVLPKQAEQIGPLG